GRADQSNNRPKTKVAFSSFANGLFRIMYTLFTRRQRRNWVGSLCNGPKFRRKNFSKGGTSTPSIKLCSRLGDGRPKNSHYSKNDRHHCQAQPVKSEDQGDVDANP